MRNILLILGIIAAVAVGGLAIYEWQGGPDSETTGPSATAAADNGAKDAGKSRAGAITADDLILGKVDAPVTVIEYASLTCPHCARFQNDVMPQIKPAYIDTGKVRWVMRDFPLDRAALAAAMVARCAGPDRRYAFIDLFFERQKIWAAASDPLKALTQTAGLAGMSASGVEACFKNEQVRRAVLNQRLEGEKVFNVDATPTFIINGTKHSGEMTFDQFKAVIDPLLNKAGQ